MNAFNIHKRITELDKRLKKIKVLERDCFEMDTKRMYNDMVDEYNFEILKLNEYLKGYELENSNELKILLKTN